MSQAEVEGQESVWVKWWMELKDDRGARAELRRCGTVSEAVFCKGFHRLRRMRGGDKVDDFEVRRLGLIAAVLSHVEVDSGESSRGAVGAAMAATAGDRPIISDARFRQLLRTPEIEFDERLPEIIRVLRQMGRRAPVNRLADDLRRWTEQTRRNWALGYYEKATQLK